MDKSQLEAFQLLQEMERERRRLGGRRRSGDEDGM
jgi:hypothetical protein